MWAWFGFLVIFIAIGVFVVLSIVFDYMSSYTAEQVSRYRKIFIGTGLAIGLTVVGGYGFMEISENSYVTYKKEADYLARNSGQFGLNKTEVSELLKKVQQDRKITGFEHSRISDMYDKAKLEERKLERKAEKELLARQVETIKKSFD